MQLSLMHMILFHNIEPHMKAILVSLFNIFLKIRFTFYKPLILKNRDTEYSIFFTIHSAKEFFLRYKLSYIAEPSTIRWIKEYIKPNHIVWDVGANVGAYSLLVGCYFRSNDSGHVFAFEPEASNFYSLNKNIVANDLSNFVTPIPIAFGNKFDVSNFFVSSLESGSATHALEKPISDGVPFNALHTQGAIQSSIDFLLANSTISSPHHIKIDVDGFESDIISGMHTLLSSNSLKSICIEIADTLSNGKLESTIESYGFSCAFYDRWANNNGVIYNIVYIR